MTSPADLEEQKKAVLPFMDKAQEIQATDPKVAYYCRMYAVEQALKFDKRAKAINDLVSAAMAQMEKEKPKLGLDRENDRYQCEALAIKVFNNADKIDRAGRATLSTAKAFLASSYFLEILNHFGPLEPDLLEKQKYAVWRAAEISKAVREGRTPRPPPSATPAPGSGTAGSLPGSNDLPPAYGGGGSSVTSSAAAAALDSLPPAYGSSSFTSNDNILGRNVPSSQAEAALPPPPPQQQPWPNSNSAAPPPPPPPPVFSYGSPGQAPSAATVGLGQRFKPGSRVLYMAEGRHGEPEHATVGQVLAGPDGSCQYRLALQDRLEVVADNGQRLVPELNEGDPVVFLAARGGPAPAHTVLVNDVSWPPTYLVRLLDGSEVAATADQLSLVEPWNAMPPPQAPASHTQVPEAGGTMPWGAMPLASLAGPSSPPKPPAYPSAYPTPSQPATSPASSPMQPPSHVARSSSPSQPHPHPALAHTQSWAAPPQAPPPLPSGALPPAAILPRGHKPSIQAIMEAQKNAKYAVSSLNFEDVPAAVKYLNNALHALTNQQ